MPLWDLVGIHNAKKSLRPFPRLYHFTKFAAFTLFSKRRHRFIILQIHLEGIEQNNHLHCPNGQTFVFDIPTLSAHAHAKFPVYYTEILTEKFVSFSK